MLRWAPTRAAGFILLVLLVVYWGLVPLLWSSPAIAVGVPTSAALDEDVPVRVVVSAWHANVRIVRVQFSLDPLRSTASGPRGLFYPVLLYNDRHQGWWPYWSLIRVRDCRVSDVGGVGDVVGRLQLVGGDTRRSVRDTGPATCRVMIGVPAVVEMRRALPDTFFSKLAASC